MARAGYKDQSLPGYNQHSGVRPVRWLGGSGRGGVDMGIAGGRPGQGRRQPHHLGLPRRFLGFHLLRTALTASRVRSCARIAGWSRHSSAYDACARSRCKGKGKGRSLPFSGSLGCEVSETSLNYVGAVPISSPSIPHLPEPKSQVPIPPDGLLDECFLRRMGIEPLRLSVRVVPRWFTSFISLHPPPRHIK